MKELWHFATAFSVSAFFLGRRIDNYFIIVNEKKIVELESADCNRIEKQLEMERTENYKM